MTLQDLQRIAEEMVDSYCKEYKLKPINIKVKKLKLGGRSRYKTRFISIPVWSYIQGGVEYFKAYIIHEIIHFIMNDIYHISGHGEKFKNLEIKLLKEIGLNPCDYRKCYYHKLEDSKGKALWIWASKNREEEGLKPYLLKE